MAYRRQVEAPLYNSVRGSPRKQSQLDMVINIEMQQILDAFRTFKVNNKPYRPKLTIVVCGKRHHTRFYPTESGDADENGNLRPGTVVDRGITAVYDFDFYLQGALSPSRALLTLSRLTGRLSIANSSWRPEGHHEANSLLRRARRDWLFGRRAAARDERRQLPLCACDKGGEPGLPCVLCRLGLLSRAVLPAIVAQRVL